jgi:hypothetical protein
LTPAFLTTSGDAFVPVKVSPNKKCGNERAMNNLCRPLILFQKKTFQAGLPDGLFSNQKYQFGKILEGPSMENLGMFYEH